MSKPISAIFATALLAVSIVSLASASPIARSPFAPFRIRPFVRLHLTPPRPPVPTHFVTMQDVLRSRAGGWQPVEAKSPFGNNGAGTELLMTDGSVMISDNVSNWYRLIPDDHGSYVEGHWKKAASLPAGYGPLYFGSAVLADGKLVVEGGEYNLGNPNPVETNLGAIYDPIRDAWTSISPPSGWSEIGDASSVVLDDGTFMLGNCCYSTQALLDESTLKWTMTGKGKADGNSEEGWTLLPDGNVLTADVGDAPNSELYHPRTGSWSSAGQLPKNLTQAFEIGPQMLRPDGTVFVGGADQYTAIYDLRTHKWAQGPDFPIVNGQQVEIADGPATLLTNGDVLMAASPSVYKTPMSMLVFDGKAFTVIAGPPNAPNDSSYNVRLLMLPTGQVLETDGSNDVEVYTPGVSPDSTIAPAITSVASSVSPGGTYPISGTLFNGVSQANAYGDDVQQATNYPLVRIRNIATGHVVYARTHDHSFMGVDSRATVTTMFDVPSDVETGASTIEVICNGIRSKPVAISVL